MQPKAAFFSLTKMSFWVKTNRIVKFLLPKLVWDIPTSDKTVYLTFDDGPIPEITEWTLSQLEQFGAKATFFCIGNNVVQNPEVYSKVIEAGHSIGNHTFSHINGWKTNADTYLANVSECEKVISSENRHKLFRPPYGKISLPQTRKLRKLGYRIIMWDIISFDFDQKIPAEKCLRNVLDNIAPGSIIVFHDSIKASENLKFALPPTLRYLKENGYNCAAITKAALERGR